MKTSNRYLRVASVLVIAGGTGHVMQYGSATLAWFGLSEAAAAAEAPRRGGPDTSISVLAAPRPGDEPGLSFIPGASEVRPALRPPLRLADPDHKQLASLETANDAWTQSHATEATCTPVLGGSEAPAAMVALELNAPCHPEAIVRIRHSVLDFVAKTDSQGRLRLEIPALDAVARVEAMLEGHASAAAVVEIPGLAQFERVAVAWAGAAALELHAFEYGASYGTEGHVWHGAPRDPAWAAGGQGGFAMRFGNPAAPVPAMADIYTFPAGSAKRDGEVRLTLETEVNRATCAQDIAGHAVQVSGGEATKPVEVVLSMPGCDAAGDFLVLDNIFPALQVDAR